VLVTYALNHAVSGLAAWSYHLVNVLLYAGAAALVFRFGRAWRLPVLAAGLGALLFAVHPVHVEVVANVAGRKDLLAAVFVLGMALLHRRTVRDGGWRLALPVALYAGAMLSKEIGVMGVILVAAQDAHLEEDRRAFFNRPRVIGLYFAYMAALAAFFLARIAVTGVVGVPETFVFDNPLVAVGHGTRIATAMVVLGKGVALLCAPLTLSPDYSFDAIPVVLSAADMRLWGAAVGLGLMAWGLTKAKLRRPVLPLALVWYALALLPASNRLIAVGTVFGERLLFLPSVAFCLAAGAGIAWAGKRSPRGTVTAATIIVTALSVQTIRYSGAWTDDIALFEWATNSVPRSTKAHHKLGEEYLRDGRLGDALRSLDRALRIAPDNAFAAATEARTRRAVEDRYGTLTASESLPDDAAVLYVLGQARREGGDAAGAVGLWESALEVDEAHAASLADLGATRLAEADTAAALSFLERAVASDSGFASAWFNLAGIHLARGEALAAIRALRSFVDAAGTAYPAQVSWARDVLAQMGAR
jgi:tetratricopeptide (TPR) repeat protein